MAYLIASALTQRAEYASAREWLSEFFATAEEFGLEFRDALRELDARPAQWARSGSVKPNARSSQSRTPRRGLMNTTRYDARSLRARILLQNGEPEAALRCVAADPAIPLIPSWKGEYLATRSLVTACLGKPDASRKAGSMARAASAALQVRGLLQSCPSRNALSEPRSVSRRMTQLIQTAGLLRNMGPHQSRAAFGASVGRCRVAAQEHLRSPLEALYLRVGDLALARRAGFRTRATAAPREVLSPRGSKFSA